MANNTTFHAIPSNVLLCSLVFKFIAMIIGTFGNVTVIIYTIFSKKEKTATSYLVGNLALADLLMCLTFYPIWIIEFIQIILKIDNDQDLFCKFSRATLWALTFTSIATLLNYSRSLSVKPLRYPHIVTHRRVFLAVSGIWITACCIFIAVYIDIISYRIGFRSMCYILNTIGYFTMGVGGYLPLLLMFFLNFRIYSVARRQRITYLSCNSDHQR